MFNFLKKKLKEVFSRTKHELEEETKEEEHKLKEEIKDIEKEKKELKQEIEEIKEKKIEDGKKKTEEIQELEQKKESIFTKLKKAFTTAKLDEENFERFFSELELVLIENNVALEAIDALKKQLKQQLLNKEIKRDQIETEIKNALEKAIATLLLEPFDLIKKIKEKILGEKPYVIVFFGINGSGKTTTIARLCYLLQHEDLSCVLAASDTFRAGSEEQLQKWATELGVEMIKHKYGADPAAVAFDAIAHAKAKGIDVVLIDTAGRMHVKVNLMKEMGKIVKVAKPDLKLFIGEAIAGNDAIEQAKAFNESTGIDAIILTKADVDERGGACISVSYITQKPILFLGCGQGYADLKRFNKKELIKNIFS